MLCAALLLLGLGVAHPLGAEREAVALDAPSRGRRVVFRLNAPREAGGAELGWAAWTRQPATRRAGERTSLELVFPADGVRVLHVEERGRRGGAEGRLVWRELGPGGGRSVSVDIHAGRAVVRDLAPGRALRRDLDWGVGARLPLALLSDVLGAGGALDTERAAPADSKRFAPAYLERFTPLGADLEPVQAEVLQLPALGAAPALRWVVLRGPDRPAGWWLFRGVEPVAFQLEAGGPIATPGPAADFPVARANSEE